MSTKKNQKESMTKMYDDIDDIPLIDLNKSNPNLKRLIAKGKDRGYVTYDELNDALEQEDLSPEQIDETMSMIGDMGISIVDSEDAYEEEGKASTYEDEELDKEPSEDAIEGEQEEELISSKTDDPVRLYLREMGNVSLLSREGEIRIAKQIEAGRLMMLGGLCESPLTASILSTWKEKLEAGTFYVRDIVSLDTSSYDEESFDEESDEEPEQRTISAAEESLYPKVMDLLSDYLMLYNNFFERRKDFKSTDALSNDLVDIKEGLVKILDDIRLSPARITQLVEYHNNLNREVLSLERQLVALAEESGIDRKNFIDHFLNQTINQKWLASIMSLSGKGWDRFRENYLPKIEEYVETIKRIEQQTEIPFNEFRRVINVIQKGERDSSRAKKEMIEANLRLVISIAKKYTNRGLQFLDLIQEGNIGLMKAVDKFEYRRGYKFSTYATWWIRQAITRSIADQARTIRIPVHMIETINKLVRTSRQMMHEIGREPTPEELSEKLMMPLDKVRKVLKIAKEPISLETPIGDEEDSHLGDFIEDRNAVLPIDSAIHANLRETTTRVLSTLTPREERVLRMRFGIGMNTDHTLEEVGQQFSVTRERIRQIEAKALRKLKHPSRSKKLRSFLES